jgi:two-component sensor histidine kinase
MRWVLVGLAALGTVLTILTTRREAESLAAFDRLRFEQAVDTAFAELERGLRSREVLMNAVATLFNPGEPIQPGALARYGRGFLSLSPEVTAISWLPAVRPERVSAFLDAVRASGIENPLIFGQNRRPVDVAALGYVPHVILDVEPRTSAPVLLGGTASDWPERRAAIDEARTQRRARTPGPTRLFQPPHPYAFLIYAPVFSPADDYLGALSFAYGVEGLFRLASPPAASERPFALHVFGDADGARRERLISLDPRGGAIGGPAFSELPQRAGAVVRTTDFAGQELALVYEPAYDASEAIWRRSLLSALLGFVLTAMVTGVVFLVVQSAKRLTVEVAARRSAEERLQVLIHELNHRVRNVLAVAQSILVRSLRPGITPNEARDLVVGRYKALGGAMALLTESEWRGADLRRILEGEMAPYAGRYEARGPDLVLRPRAAQTMALVVHELVTNSVKHGALSLPSGVVTISWGQEGAGAEFTLRWVERGGPPYEPPSRVGFGTQILTRVAPSDLNGTAVIDHAAEGMTYTLRAPLEDLREAEPSSGA